MSIIVPAYNEELVLENCIHSLSTLDYPDYEIIIVDDGSIDKTAEIGKQLEKNIQMLVFILRKMVAKQML